MRKKNKSGWCHSPSPERRENLLHRTIVKVGVTWTGGKINFPTPKDVTTLSLTPTIDLK